MGTNASELGRTLTYLRKHGRLETIDAALVQVARSLARAVDDDPGNAQLWRQYRESVKDLTNHGRRNPDDPINAQLAKLFSQANMGDAEKT